MRKPLDWFILMVAITAYLSTHVSSARVLHVRQQYPTVAAAVNSAATGDTILLQPGVYLEQVVLDSVQLTIAGESIFFHDTTSFYSTIIALPDSLRLDSSDFRSVIRIQRHSDITLYGFTVRNGLGTTFSSQRWPVLSVLGGSIFASDSKVRMNWCRITNSRAQSGGGAFFLDTDFWMNHCRVDFCSGYALNHSGGGIFLKADTAIVENSLFYRNEHITYTAGGLHMSTYRHGKVIGSTFRENRSNIGVGGGFLNNVQIVSDCLVEGNESAYHAGLALNANNEGSDSVFHFRNNVIQNNQTQQVFSEPSHEGGGIIITNYNPYSQQWFIEGNTFRENLSGSVSSPRDGGCLVIQRGNAIIRGNHFISNRGRFGVACLARLSMTTVLFDSNSVIGNVGESTIRFFNLANGSIINNDFINNGGVIFTRDNSDTVSTALTNYWGDPSGPRCVGNPQGLGDSLGANVPFTPFLSEPVFPQNDAGGGGKPIVYPFTVKECGLLRTYPNPANSSVTISYSLPHFVKNTRIELFDPLGRRVSILYDGFLTAGEHRFQWHPEKTSSGTYFVRATNEFSTPPNVMAIQFVK